jgi:hypothetical protein
VKQAHLDCETGTAINMVRGVGRHWLLSFHIGLRIFAGQRGRRLGTSLDR